MQSYYYSKSTINLPQHCKYINSNFSRLRLKIGARRRKNWRLAPHAPPPTLRGCPQVTVRRRPGCICGASSWGSGPDPAPAAGHATDRRKGAHVPPRPGGLPRGSLRTAAGPATVWHCAAGCAGSRRFRGSRVARQCTAPERARRHPAGLWRCDSGPPPARGRRGADCPIASLALRLGC
jgi:hypothetical protein